MTPFDPWDRDQWGNWEPGACIRNIPTVASTPANAYVTEDLSAFYVAEDGVTFYVQETG